MKDRCSVPVPDCLLDSVLIPPEDVHQYLLAAVAHGVLVHTDENLTARIVVALVVLQALHPKLVRRIKAQRIPARRALDRVAHGVLTNLDVVGCHPHDRPARNLLEQELRVGVDQVRFGAPTDLSMTACDDLVDGSLRVRDTAEHRRPPLCTRNGDLVFVDAHARFPFRITEVVLEPYKGVSVVVLPLLQGVRLLDLDAIGTIGSDDRLAKLRLIARFVEKVNTPAAWEFLHPAHMFGCERRLARFRPTSVVDHPPHDQTVGLVKNA